MGRFGMSIYKLATMVVSMDEFKEILSTREVNSYVEIDDNNVLVSFSKEFDSKIIREHGLDYQEILNSKSRVDVESINYFDDVSISISAAITSYSRIYMNKIKLDILKRGGKLYYSDTDSIVTDVELDQDMVGTGLGQLKLECEASKGYFISSKTYCLVLKKKHYDKESKELRIKAKGVNEHSLKLSSFKEMYLNNKSVEAQKTSSKLDYAEGYVDISTDTVKLSPNAYTKRSKIYDSGGL